MESSLKKKLEEIPVGAADYFSKNKVPSRIVLCFSGNKFRNDSFEILSRVETLFLNDPFRMEKKIKVVNSLVHRATIEPEPGDCNIDVGFLLKEKEFRDFLLKEGVANYTRDFSAFESWAKQYRGMYRTYLSKFVECLEKRNSGGVERVWPPLDPLSIDSVFGEIGNELSYQLIS